MNETKPLKPFIITVDSKPFIKCDNPKVRADFKWKKIKCRSFKMADIVQELTDAIVTAIINAHGYPDLSEEDLRNIIRGIVDNQMA